MEKLNIIHLDKNKERRLSFMKQAIEQQVNISVWPGIIVEGKPFTGISRAYKQVVWQAQEEGLEYVHIADDDFLFTCERSWQYYLEKMPKVFDLYLGGISGGEITSGNHIPQWWSGTFFFTVHSRFYDAFLSADEDKNIDRWLSWHGLGLLKERLGREPLYKVCYPIPVICMDSISDNSGKFMEHEKYFRPYEKLKSSI